ncbi:peptidoglycan endopeptidase [Oxalobacteraceae bacterium CAVE-383]|nr:peptidoglycan endopeptidase [Oxalobacteraceae bacterium CAVE-383]
MQPNGTGRGDSYSESSRPAVYLARLISLFAAFFAASLLAACSVVPTSPSVSRFSTPPAPQPASETGNEVALYALDLIGTGYRFGGKNPQAGLDCSGMVSYIYRQAAGISVSGSAADIARRGREIDPKTLRPGDLVFFNTEHKPFSHVAIYIGENRFVHAPSTNGHVRIDRLDNHYYAERYEMARRYFD